MVTTPKAVIEELTLIGDNVGYGIMLITDATMFTALPAEQMSTILELGDTGDRAIWHIAAPTMSLPAAINAVSEPIEAFLDHLNTTGNRKCKATVLFWDQVGLISRRVLGDEACANALVFKVYVGSFWNSDFGDWSCVVKHFTGIKVVGIEGAIPSETIEDYVFDLMDFGIKLEPIVVVRPGPRIGYVVNGIRLAD